MLVLAYLESKDGAEAKTFAEVAQQLRNGAPGSCLASFVLGTLPLPLPLRAVARPARRHPLPLPPAARLLLPADMDFAFVTDRSLIEECKSASDCKSPFVVMHKAGEEEVPRYEGDFKAGLLQAWAGAKSLPSVIKFG